MSIRLACPTCQTALTLPDTSAGKSRVCPKCNLMFRVPVPESLANRPVPEAQLLSEDSYVPDPVDSRPAPRPIYKQTPASHKSDALNAEGSGRKSGERPRRRKRTRAKETKIPPAVLIGGGIAGLALLIGLIFAIVHFSGEEPNGPKSPPQNDEGKSAVSEGPPIPTGPTYMSLPNTWSTNDPKLGFVTAWPVPKGILGYTTIESLVVGFDGMTPNSWSYTEMGTRIIFRVNVTDLVADDAKDEETILDRYVDRARLKSPKSTEVKSLSLKSGESARQISFVSEGDRSISRVAIKKGRLWTAQVSCPQHILANDEKLNRFLSLFELH